MVAPEVAEVRATVLAVEYVPGATPNSGAATAPVITYSPEVTVEVVQPER